VELIVLGVCNIVVKRIQRAGVKPWVCSESADHMEISSTDQSCWAFWFVHFLVLFWWLITSAKDVTW